MREATVRDGARRAEHIEDLRCPIMSEKTIIRLRRRSLRNTFEGKRRGEEERSRTATKLPSKSKSK